MPEGEPIYTTQRGQGYEVYADGGLDIGGDVLGSRDTVLQPVRRTGARPVRKDFGQIEVCEEAGFSVPGRDSLPGTGEAPFLAVPAALLLPLGGAGLLLGVRR